MRFLSALLLSPILVFTSCERQTEPPVTEEKPVDASIERTRNEIAELEAGVEEFREQIVRSMNQHAVDQMTPEEIEALRKSEIKLPEGVEIPSEE